MSAGARLRLWSVSVGLACALVGVGGHAHADAPPPPSSGQPQVSLRSLGWSVPYGKIARGSGALSEVIGGAYPLILDLGIKPRSWLVVGMYLGFSVGPGGSATGACKQIASCGAANFRIGAQAQIHFAPAARWNPWLSYGAGFESVQFLAELGRENDAVQPTLRATYRGIEIAQLGFGLDRRLNDTLGIGPFVSGSVGMFRSITADVFNGDTYQLTFDRRAVHGWFTVGVRATLFP